MSDTPKISDGVREALEEHNYKIVRMMAYQGKVGCKSLTCTRIFPEGEDISCYGWHCPTCHEPTGPYGHDCPQEGT